MKEDAITVRKLIVASVFVIAFVIAFVSLIMFCTIVCPNLMHYFRTQTQIKTEEMHDEYARRKSIADLKTIEQIQNRLDELGISNTYKIVKKEE